MGFAPTRKPGRAILKFSDAWSSGVDFGTLRSTMQREMNQEEVGRFGVWWMVDVAEEG